MPDGIVDANDVVQLVGHRGQDMGLSVTEGNTVIFDSYTPKEEVHRRDIANNNVSKLNQMQNRFATEFCIGIRAISVTAVLSADTVEAYRVIDKKTGQVLGASDKRPKYMR